MASIIREKGIDRLIFENKLRVANNCYVITVPKWAVKVMDWEKGLPMKISMHKETKNEKD